MVVRCRPLSEKEKISDDTRIVNAWPSRGVIEIINPKDRARENKKMFTYDAVYDWLYVTARCASFRKNNTIVFPARPSRICMMRRFGLWCLRFLRGLTVAFLFMDKREQARLTRWKASLTTWRNWEWFRERLNKFGLTSTVRIMHSF